MENSRLNRRSFLKTSTLGTLGTMSIPALLGGCSNTASKDDQLKNVSVIEIMDKAPDGKLLKAGLVGCGSRGTGAACNLLDAGNNLQVIAIGDIFKDKVDACHKTLKSKGQQIADENCFVGFDAYQKVIDSGVDVVLLCTPPVFRHIHFEYAIQKGKHCFIEKPCAVDPVGAKKMLIVGKQATQKDLSVVSGFTRRWRKDCIETYRRVAGGAIGEIVSAHILYMRGSIWFRIREKGWDDMEYMLRNWVNFRWLFGDIIVDDLVHFIDMMSWFMGEKRPVRAEADGGRHRNLTGDIYDFFHIEYLFDNGIRAHCTERIIDGCDNQTAILLYGTKGYVDCEKGTIYNLDGTIAWQYPYPKPEDPDQSMKVPDPFVQEHIHLITAIRTNKPINDVDKHAQSTLMAIMGRESAYTGKFITWDQIMASNLKLGPETYEFGNVPWFKEEILVPGTVSNRQRSS